MNNRGFTLTELLAVIAILAVISTIAGFSYTKIMKDNRIKQCEQKVLYIEKQAIKYASDDEYFQIYDNYSVDIDELVKYNYLIKDADNNDALNPLTGEDFNGKVHVYFDNDLMNAEYDGDKCE